MTTVATDQAREAGLVDLGARPAEELLAFGDAQLADAIYDTVACVDSEALSDRFYFLLAEAFERFAPNVELELRRRGNVDGEDGIRGMLEGMRDRHAGRLEARMARQRRRMGDDA